MSEYPRTATKEWHDFAIFNVEVENTSALDGNSGSSSFTIEVGAGTVDVTLVDVLAPDKVMTAHTPKLRFEFSGESEHRLTIEALRFIADKLEEFTS